MPGPIGRRRDVGTDPVAGAPRRGFRWLRHPTAGAWTSGPLPDVPDAPADAEPVIQPRLDDNGLATYTMVIPRDTEASQ